MTIHISFDLETWGTSPGCDIRSIGAVVFDPVTGEVAGPDGACGVVNGVDQTFYLATDNPRGYWSSGTVGSRFFETGKHTDRLKYPLKRDPSTIKWWSEQSAEAQAAFENPVDLRDALLRFTGWIVNMYPAPWDGKPSDHVRIWAHGSHFDPPILTAAYEAVGLPIPWHYRAPRDTRTCFDMAGIDDHSAWLAQTPGPLGVSHHALDDAICQARAVCAAYDLLRETFVDDNGVRWSAVTLPGETGAEAAAALRGPITWGTAKQ